MALSEHDEVEIREYLLGKLSDDQLEQIEQRLMVEDDLFQELEISKTELIEEYRAGELNRKEAAWFERFLASPEGRQRHEFAVAIECLERSRKPPTPSVWEKIQLIFRRPRWAAATGTLAVLATLAAVGLLRQPAIHSFPITLTSNSVTRGPGDTPDPVITVPPGTTELKVTLTLLQAGPPDARYQVELDKRPTSTLLETSGQDTNSVSVVIPIKTIPPGFYGFRIYEMKKDGTRQQIPGTYTFTRQ